MNYLALGKLKVTSDSFANDGMIPVKYTGRGEDISPNLKISEISEKAKSIVIIMDDLDHPFPDYNHWVIWNIPIQESIPEGIPHGDIVASLNGAVQGVGYGKHAYRGPKPPKCMKAPHRYKFNVFTLDCMLEIRSTSRKRAVLRSMEGHILQYGHITGVFKNK